MIERGKVKTLALRRTKNVESAARYWALALNEFGTRLCDLA